MKKVIVFLSCICLLFAVGCKSSLDLSNYVSDLRENVYVGESQDLSVKAYYGYKETPFNNDGEVGKKVNYLSVKLLNVSNNETLYSASTEINGNSLSGNFKFNPISNLLSVNFELDSPPPDEFDVTITSANLNQTITLKSIIPENTITYKYALESLSKSQPELIGNYVVDGVFTAEIYARIIVKNEKPYWYVGFAKNNKITALLVDGFTAEVLAIKSLY